MADDILLQGKTYSWLCDDQGRAYVVVKDTAEYATQYDSVSVFINAASQALSLTSYSATIALHKTVATNVDAIVLTTHAASVAADIGIPTNVAALILIEYQATIKFDAGVTASNVAITLTTKAASIFAGAASSGIFKVGRQMLSVKSDTVVPLEVSVDNTGGVAGLAVTAAIRDGSDSTKYLDFNDNTFKSSAWTSKTLALTDLGGGFYYNTFSLPAITNLGANTRHLIVEYTISGSVVGVTNDTISFLDDYLTVGKFIGLK